MYPGLTTPSLDAPFYNPEDASSDWVEVTDCTHPLVGRRFQIISIARGDEATAHVFVRYSDDIVLRVLIAATTLSGLEHSTAHSKLSAPAVEEFLTLVKEYELCPTQPKSKPTKSGRRSRRTINSKSQKNSNKSSRR